MNNDDNKLSTAKPRAALNVYMPTFTNPFAKIVQESQKAPSKPGHAQLTQVRPGVDGVFGRERRPFDPPPQTPQRHPLLSPTPRRDDNNVSVLSPYVNFLNGKAPKTAPTPVPQLRTHVFQQPTVQQQPSSSPIPEQWNHDESLPHQISNQTGGLGNVGSDDNMIEELKNAYKSLSEQTKRTESLQYQVISLKNARNTIAREHAQKVQELEAVKAKQNEATAENNALRSQVERTEAAWNVTKEQLLKTGEHVNVKTAESSELAEKLEQVMREMEEVKTEYAKEVAKGKDTAVRAAEANKKIKELVAAYGNMEKSLQELGETQNMYHRLVDKTSEDVREIKTVSSEAGAKITAFTAPGGNHELLSNAKASIMELRDDLADSHHVNDILRDKLYSTSAQLADATTKVQELEQEKCDVWGRTIESVAQNAQLQNSLVSSDNKIMELTTKLRTYEEEAIGLLAKEAQLQAKIDQATKHAAELELELARLRPLQQEKLQLQTEIADLTRRFADETASRTKLQTRVEESRDALIFAEKELLVTRTQMQDALDSRREMAAELSNLKIVHKESETQLSSLQEVIHKRDQDIAALQAKLNSGEDLRDQLRTMVSQEQAISARLQQELKETGIREAMAIGKVDIFEVKVTHLTRELGVRDDMLRQLSAKVATVQERYEAQASTLRLTKEELGNIQERLLIVHTNNEAALGALRSEIAVLQEQRSSLSSIIDKMREERKDQDILRVQARDLQATHQEVQQLREERDKHVVNAEQEASRAKTREVELMAKIQELEAAVVEINDRRHNEEKSRVLEKGRIRELDAQVAALMTEKGELLQRQETLLERYGSGKLSDIEKDFAELLVHDARDLHEQAAIAKDHEIKRRDALIVSLQERVAGLESTLAYALQPADVVSGIPTILNLTVSPPVGFPEPMQEVQNTQDATHISPLAPTNTGILIHELGPGGPSHGATGVLPLSSQMPSELSTPPQSPRPMKTKESGVSFVRLSKEDSEIDDNTGDQLSVKRPLEATPVAETVASKKRSVQAPRIGMTLTNAFQRITAMKPASHEVNKIPERTTRGKQKKKKVTM